VYEVTCEDAGWCRGVREGVDAAFFLFKGSWTKRVESQSCISASGVFPSFSHRSAIYLTSRGCNISISLGGYPLL